jgi:hypothetical protein
MSDSLPPQPKPAQWLMPTAIAVLMGVGLASAAVYGKHWFAQQQRVQQAQLDASLQSIAREVEEKIAEAEIRAAPETPEPEAAAEVPETSRPTEPEITPETLSALEQEIAELKSKLANAEEKEKSLPLTVTHAKAVSAWMDLRARILAGEPHSASLRALKATGYRWHEDALRILATHNTVPTRAQLKTSLDAVLETLPKEPPLLSILTSEKEGVLARLDAMLANHIQVRNAAELKAAAHYTALRAHADAGELMAASRSIAALPETLQTPFAAWQREYQQAQQARRALHLLATELESPMKKEAE